MQQHQTYILNNRKIMFLIFLSYIFVAGLNNTSVWGLSTENGEKFSFDIIKKVVQQSEKNIFLSVSGLLESLSILYEASDGLTEHLLEQQFQTTKDVQRNYYKSFKQKILKSKNTSHTTFSQKTFIFHNQNVEIYPTFQSIIEQYYQCSVLPLQTSVNGLSYDLKDVYHKIDILTNKTVKTNLFDAALSSLLDTEILLVNTNYFNSAWLKPFDPTDTKPRTFTSLDGSKIQVPFMESDGRFMVHYADTLKITLLKLPYADSQFFLLILLPDKEIEIDNMISNLTWHTIKKNIPSKLAPIEVKIPKFMVDSKTSLDNCLIEFGLGHLFMPELNLSAMTSANKLSLNNIVQVSHFTMDENGSEASSDTYMSIGFRSLTIPNTIIFDRPFVFYLVQTETNFPIYMGKIVAFH